MKAVRRWRPSAAMVVACIALFVALGGGAYAAATINGKSIKNGTVTPNKIKARSMSGSQFRANGIGGPSIKESTLGEVPKAKTAASATSATNATNSAQLGGQPAASYQRYGLPLPAAHTITGSFGCYQEDAATGVTGCRSVISLPASAPVALTDATVNFAANAANFVATDADPSCPGNAANPSAPAGKVCLYFANRLGNAPDISGQGNIVSGGNASNGFEVQLTAGGAGLSPLSVEGTWAYTAP